MQKVLLRDKINKINNMHQISNMHTKFQYNVANYNTILNNKNKYDVTIKQIVTNLEKANINTHAKMEKAINAEEWENLNEILFTIPNFEQTPPVPRTQQYISSSIPTNMSSFNMCIESSPVYQCHACNKNLASLDPVSQYQRQKIIQNTVRVSSSLYSMNVGALTVYQSPNKMGVNWNQMSDRKDEHIQKAAISMKSSVSIRPGNLTPGGKGCDIKHNSYARYLARLKGSAPLRKGIIPPNYGEAYIPFNPAYPIYGGKTVKTSIGSSKCSVCSTIQMPTPMPTPIPTPIPTPMPTPMPTPIPTPIPGWNNPFGAGIDGQVNAIGYSPTLQMFKNYSSSEFSITGSNGYIYIGGNFTTANGITVNNISMWNGSSFSALGQGLNGLVNSIAIDSIGNIYVGGEFTSAYNGVLNTLNHIAMWNGASWSALGEGLNGPVNSIAIDSTGNIYVGGAFTGEYNSPNALNYIAKWSSNSWGQLSLGLNYNVNAIAIDSTDDVYVGGAFTAEYDSPDPLHYIAKWSGDSWGQLNTGLSGQVNAIAINGEDIYIGGLFATYNDVTPYVVNNIVMWNGTNWNPLTDSLGNVGLNNAVYSISISQDGLDVYIGGLFTSQEGGIANTLNYIVRWNSL